MFGEGTAAGNFSKVLSGKASNYVCSDEINKLVSLVDSLSCPFSCLQKDASLQKFVGLQDVWKMSSRHVLKKSWRRLQRNNFSSFKTLKTSSRRLQDMSWKRLKDMSWRRFGDQQNFYRDPYLTNVNLHLANLYLTNIYLTNLKRIQDKSKMH